MISLSFSNCTSVSGFVPAPARLSAVRCTFAMYNTNPSLEPRLPVHVPLHHEVEHRGSGWYIISHYSSSALPYCPFLFTLSFMLFTMSVQLCFFSWEYSRKVVWLDRLHLQNRLWLGFPGGLRTVCCMSSQPAVVTEAVDSRYSGIFWPLLEMLLQNCTMVFFPQVKKHCCKILNSWEYSISSAISFH